MALYNCNQFIDDPPIKSAVLMTGVSVVTGSTSRCSRFGALESWSSNWPMESAQCFYPWEMANGGKMMQECQSNGFNGDCFQDSKSF